MISKKTIRLFNNHLQTIFGLKFRGRSSYKPKREDVFFKDGGQATIEYFVDEKNLTEESIKKMFNMKQLKQFIAEKLHVSNYKEENKFHGYITNEAKI